MKLPKLNLPKLRDPSQFKVWHAGIIGSICGGGVAFVGALFQGHVIVTDSALRLILDGITWTGAIAVWVLAFVLRRLTRRFTQTHREHHEELDAALASIQQQGNAINAAGAATRDWLSHLAECDACRQGPQHLCPLGQILYPAWQNAMTELVPAEIRQEVDQMMKRAGRGEGV